MFISLVIYKVKHIVQDGKMQNPGETENCSFNDIVIL